MATNKRKRPRVSQTNLSLGRPVEDAIDAIGARLGIRHRTETVRFLVHEKARALGIEIALPVEAPEAEASNGDSTPPPPATRVAKASSRRR